MDLLIRPRPKRLVLGLLACSLWSCGEVPTIQSPDSLPFLSVVAAVGLDVVFASFSDGARGAPPVELSVDLEGETATLGPGLPICSGAWGLCLASALPLHAGDKVTLRGALNGGNTFQAQAVVPPRAAVDSIRPGRSSSGRVPELLIFWATEAPVARLEATATLAGALVDGEWRRNCFASFGRREAQGRRVPATIPAGVVVCGDPVLADSVALEVHLVTFDETFAAYLDAAARAVGFPEGSVSELADGLAGFFGSSNAEEVCLRLGLRGTLPSPLAPVPCPQGTPHG